MAHWPLNWNVVRHDLVVGSGPREPSDLDALRLETHVSAMLSVQHDDCLAHQGIDYPGLVRHGRRISLTLVRAPLRCAISIPPISGVACRRRCVRCTGCCARATGSTSIAPPASTAHRWWC